MNPMTSTHEPAIRDIPLCRLALAPENVRKTPPDEAAEVQLRASIAAHGLLKNLVARPDAPDADGVERFAVVAGGRRLAALQALAENGTLHADHPVPCKIATNGSAQELSLAENVNHLPMHPADQVVAFAGFVQSGATVATIATRFGVSERLVEQRLRLGNAAPELIDAYRAEAIDLETLKAFAVTTDHERQLSVWEQVSAQGHRPNAWQVKRLLTEERVPANAAIARFVGVDAYEAAGGAVLRDLFADEYENGVWLEDPKLFTELATQRLAAAAAELATRWKWAEAMLEVDWSPTARYGRIRPQPSEPTGAETAEIERLRPRHDEIATLEEHELTEEIAKETEGIEMRLDAIEIAADDAGRDHRVNGEVPTIPNTEVRNRERLR
ncbi:MAG: ParB N-terminal domain-containing protein [Alphaproteobacteria bacterium]|nr:ParB N-terminal domain-containing protein [Alphaproteobacteria bacterium]